MIKLPLYIETGVKKVVKRHININNYRNWKFHLSNDIKKRYKQSIKDQLCGLSLGKVHLIFTYYAPDRRRRDITNVLCIHDKFAVDALVEEGCLEDDNYDYVLSSHYLFGGIDKDNPRVDLEIWED